MGGLNLKKLSTENPFFDFMGNVGDYMIINILFILTSLPVITVGMSFTAMYRMTLRRRRNESNYVIREYFQICREEWKQSTKLWIIFLISGSLLVFDAVYTKNSWGGLFGIALGCIITLWSFLFSYVFPLQARFENTIKDTMKNALILSVRYLPYTVIIVLLNAIPFLCIAAGVFVARMAMPIYFFFGFAFTARINSIFFEKIFGGLINKEETE